MRRLVFCTFVVLLLSLSPRAHAEVTGHQLRGKVWLPASGSFITVGELIQQLSSRRIVLIGERHGRTAHQDREAFLLAALAEQGRYPTLALEMLTPADDELIRRHRAASPEHSGGLSRLLGWPDSGWPAWRYYKPLFDISLAAKLHIVGADLAQASEAFAQARMPVDAIGQSWLASLDEAHCNLLDKAALADKAAHQIERDRHMAQRLENHAARNPHGVVLVAGSAHVRKDRGIPHYLTSVPDQIFSLALIEARAGLSAPEHLPVAIGSRTDVFDAVWFTPRKPVPSPCAKLK